MKFVVLAALCAATFAFVPIDHKSALETITGQALVDYVNSAQNMFTTQHTEVSDEEMKSRVMDGKYAAAHSDEIRATERAQVLDTIPATFDSRSAWPECKSIKQIRNQATCGSCWAFGAAETISDRICIETKGAQQPIISPDDILSCCGSSCGNGCEGGYPIQALRWWDSKGVVTGGDYKGAGCKPYPIAPCTSGSCPESKTPSCSLSCQSGYSTAYAKDKHFGTSAYAVAKKVASIQTEIHENGPVEAAFSVYEDFYKYTSGVYKHTAGKYLGGHAIKIIGWGTESGSPYWLVANSWGTDWGESGFFKILRGVDECGIESAVVAGKAKV
uniref:Pept_C1 domain-containing protein n=1 Tax=Caenorhabditis japonica TaxID=281687 RepID=A0A8R1EF30_CAEJA